MRKSFEESALRILLGLTKLPKAFLLGAGKFPI